MNHFKDCNTTVLCMALKVLQCVVGSDRVFVCSNANDGAKASGAGARAEPTAEEKAEVVAAKKLRKKFSKVARKARKSAEASREEGNMEEAKNYEAEARLADVKAITHGQMEYTVLLLRGELDGASSKDDTPEQREVK